MLSTRRSCPASFAHISRSRPSARPVWPLAMRGARCGPDWPWFPRGAATPSASGRPRASGSLTRPQGCRPSV
eukprot:11224325-Lingulodinium_polyedra.AAC.1